MLFQDGVFFGFFQVGGHHFGAHLLHGDFGCPAQLGFGFGGVAEQSLHLGGAEVARVDFDDHITHLEAWGFVARHSSNGGGFVDALAFKFEGDAQLFGAPLDELTHAVLHTGGHHKIFCFVLLQHQPLHAHIVFRVPPVAQGV